MPALQSRTHGASAGVTALGTEALRVPAHAESWSQACLVALVHLSGASAGLLLDDGGVVCASSRLSDADREAITVAALTPRMQDLVPSALDVPSGRVRAVRAPLRSGGRYVGLVVLACSEEARIEPDQAVVSSMLASIAQVMAERTRWPGLP